jgi:DNA-directed RNA polymerase alpha subunit
MRDWINVSENTSDEMIKLAYFLRKYEAAGGNVDDLANISDIGAARVVEAVSFSETTHFSGEVPDIGEVFSMQTSNLLVRQIGNVSLRELTRWDEEQLLRINNFGQKRLKEVKDLLHEYGLKLAEAHH